MIAGDAEGLEGHDAEVGALEQVGAHVLVGPQDLTARGHATEGRELDGQVDRAHRRDAVDGEALALLAEAREEGGRFREELAPLFPRVLDTLGRAADAADALKEVGP